LPVVQWLLRKGGACATDTNMFGHSALLMAACNGRLAVVQWLLAGGRAHIQEVNLDGNTALLLGAYNGQLSLVQWLLEKGGASAEETNLVGDTALHMAAITNNLPVVQWLVTKGGVAPRATNARGDTVLLVAIRGGRVATVEWLLGYSSDLLVPNDARLWSIVCSRHARVLHTQERPGGVPETRLSDPFACMLRVLLCRTAPSRQLRRCLHEDLRGLLATGRLMRARLPLWRNLHTALLQASLPGQLLVSDTLALVAAYAVPSSEELWRYATLVDATQ
jgi:ankyrin repeat protein